ncbi:MAG: hypothetical protein WBB28_00640 [Crinalium sp.]
MKGILGLTQLPTGCQEPDAVKVARPVLKERCIAVIRTSTLIIAILTGFVHSNPEARKLMRALAVKMALQIK